MTLLRHGALLLIGVMFWTVVGLAIFASVTEACEMTPVEDYNPTGWEGCTVYGTGIASQWGGPGVARNDCVFPWTNCQTISITSLVTGRTIVVTPTMFGDLYHGTPDQRLVDLDPESLAALGLDPSRGLHPVRVEPTIQVMPFVLPNTAMETP